MSRGRYYRNLDAQSEFYEEENRRRDNEFENNYWHSEAGQYHIRYNDEREDEINRRNSEVYNNLKNFYFSRNGILIALGTTIGLAILTGTAEITYILGWFVIIALIVIGYYFLTAKTNVRREITSRQEMIHRSARDKVYRR